MKIKELTYSITNKLLILVLISIESNSFCSLIQKYKETFDLNSKDSNEVQSNS